MRTILLTGTTGTIGSAIVKKLIKKNNKLVCLLRGNDQNEARERLRKVVGDVADIVEIVNGDMSEMHCGVSVSERNRLKNMNINEIIHSAGILKFFSAKTQVENITGTRNVLYLAEDLGIPKITFLSTAYVAGNSKKFYDDDFFVNQKSNNDYEESKLECEKIIRNSGLRWVILRPSIVTGDDRTGEVATFSGFYTWFQAFWNMKKYLFQKWKRGGKDKKVLEESGIFFTSEGILNFPVVISCGPRPCSLNLIPINVLADQIAKIVDSDVSEEVFNIVNPDPPYVQDIIIGGLKYLGIQGYQFTFEQDKNSTPNFLKKLKDKIVFLARIPYGYLLYRLQKRKNPEMKFLINRLYPKSFLKGLQGKLDYGLNPFSSYVTQGPDFGDQSKVKQLLGDDYLLPRKFDYDHYSLLLEYAIQNCYSKGGKNLESSEETEKKVVFKKAA